MVDPGLGFLCRLFLMEKGTGEWRPMIDVSPQTGLSSNPVQDGDSALGTVFHPGGRFANLDRSEECEQVVEEVYGSFLVAWYFSSRPWASDCLPLHRCSLQSLLGLILGILLRYLGDWLILASLENELRRLIQRLQSLCHDLGIVVNEKSDLEPKRRSTFPEWSSILRWAGYV